MTLRLRSQQARQLRSGQTPRLRSGRAERLYAALLMLYPAAFRREYGEPMKEAFRTLRLEHRRGPAALWFFVITDLCRSAGREHLEAWWPHPRRLVLHWAMACALGTLAGGVLANALARSFSYFYHPFLEGLTLPPWSYGALLGLGLSGAQCAVLRRHLRLGGTWVFVSVAAAALGLQVAIVIANVFVPEMNDAVKYGIVLGAFVGGGQWLVLRTRVRRAGWWVMANAVALPAAVLSCGVALKGTLHGMNALSNDLLPVQDAVGDGQVLSLLLRGLNGPNSWMDLAMACVLIALSGLVIGVVTARPLTTMLARAPLS